MALLQTPFSTVRFQCLYRVYQNANISLIQDTYSTPLLLNPSGSSESSQPYEFSQNGIAWPGEAKKYTTSPIGPGGYNSLDDIVPPPNWQARFPNNYTTDNPPPDLRSDERFQNWMRTAGLPTFTKLYGRNDKDTMQKGTYQIIVGLSMCIRIYIQLISANVYIQIFLFFLTKGPNQLLFQLSHGLEERILFWVGHTSLHPLFSFCLLFWVLLVTSSNQGKLHTNVEEAPA